MWTEKINELYHYGILGMKWGVRRKHDNHSDGAARHKREKTNKVRTKPTKAPRQDIWTYDGGVLITCENADGRKYINKLKPYTSLSSKKDGDVYVTSKLKRRDLNGLMYSLRKFGKNNDWNSQAALLSDRLSDAHYEYGSRSYDERKNGQTVKRTTQTLVLHGDDRALIMQAMDDRIQRCEVMPYSPDQVYMQGGQLGLRW